MPENKTTDIVVHGLYGEHPHGWGLYENVEIETDLRSWLRSNFFQDIEPLQYQTSPFLRMQKDLWKDEYTGRERRGVFVVTDLHTAEQTYWELIGDLE